VTNTPTPSPTVTNTPTPTPTPSPAASEFYYGGDKLVAQEVPRQGVKQLEYVAADYLGSSRVVSKDVNSDTVVVSNSHYEPFGKALSPAALTPFKFSGNELDASGFAYFGARYYHPSIGRFLAVDPLFDGTGNSYAYAENNPLKFVDPDGFQSGPPVGNLPSGLSLHYDTLASSGFSRLLAPIKAGYQVGINPYTNKAFFDASEKLLVFPGNVDIGVFAHEASHALGQFQSVHSNSELLKRSSGIPQRTYLGSASAKSHVLKEYAATRVQATLTKRFNPLGLQAEEVAALGGFKSFERFYWTSAKSPWIAEYREVLKTPLKYVPGAIKSGLFSSALKSESRLLGRSLLRLASNGKRYLGPAAICIGLACAATEAYAGDWSGAFGTVHDTLSPFPNHLLEVYGNNQPMFINPATFADQ